MAAAPHTVCQAIALCGVDDAAMFHGRTQAQCFAEEIFGNDFASGVDKTYKELQDDFKSYSTLNVNQGQICLNPGVKQNLCAFLQ